jgi:phage gp36-like protein
MAYATSADLLVRKDAREVGCLVADNDDRVAESLLSSDAKVTAALSGASGEVNAALLTGGRYTVAQLESLTGDALAYLKDIVCELAMYRLYRRRPDISRDALEYYAQLRETLLGMLRSGQDVFNLDSQIDATLPEVDGPTTLGIVRLNLIRDRAHGFYPARHMPDNR